MFGESRWPPAIAVFIFLLMDVAGSIWLPRSGILTFPWLLPTVETVILIVLLFGHPGGLVKQRRLLRPIAIVLVLAMVASALWATIRLTNDLIWGSKLTNEPALLLASGGLVWLGNVLSFALLFWLLDSGGPAQRARRERPADFAFTQQLTPEVAPAGWRPAFLDYLHLAFTNSTAFSPTDVMPLSLRAKYAMVVQSTVALALFGLIVARAVNAFH
ncbi:hypothetical protein LK09_15670 [Microbacterium mangrovi]|uniref:DUF1345 domain-containing protein n=1 Tax=Microbacterium mangrovi TaxID=1348253 RepID=A0A0B2A0C4_9MICO|nr:hypothetical protein LK09_15670 [Microbacterium mangrovi]